MLIYSAKWSVSDTFWQIMMPNVSSLFIPSSNVFSFRTQSWPGGPSLDAPTWHWNQLTSQPHQHLTTMMSSHCRNKIQFKTASPQPRWLAFSIFKYIHVSQALNKASFQYYPLSLPLIMLGGVSRSQPQPSQPQQESASATMFLCQLPVNKRKLSLLTVSN